MPLNIPSWIHLKNLKDIERLLNIKYRTYLNDRLFSLQASDHHDTIIAITTLQNPDQSFVYPVHTKIPSWQESFSSPKEAFYFLVDYMDLYWSEFFESAEDLFLPIDWNQHQYNAEELWIKGQILNLKMEKLGDDLLHQQAPKDLTHSTSTQAKIGDDPSTDALSIPVFTD